MTKVTGIHCYLGGFLLGLKQAGLEICQSLEVWKSGFQGAKAINLPVENISEIPRNLKKTEIVVGNPPCSRFSHLSLSFFDKETRQDPKTFPEIIDLVRVAKNTNAKVIWWETGPLAWTIGRDLLKNFHESLYNIWDRVTTLLVRLDLRYLGIPQKRPRIHVIHINTGVKPPSVPRSVWPSKYKLGEWLEDKTKNYKLRYPIFPQKTNNPVGWARKQAREMTFRSMVPKIISRKSWYTGSVVSRRIMVWKEENRWFDLLEYAALMTYPLEEIENVLSVLRKPLNTQVLISKSVAPAASKWIAEKIVLPWLNQKKITEPVRPSTYYRGIWELDLTIPNKIDNILRSGQEIILSV